MIEHRGIWLPDGEGHLLSHLDKGPLVDGVGTYQLHKLQMGLQHTIMRRTAVDVGAHVGMWSRILAKHFAHVEAFEPVPEHRECFRLNVTAENVALHPSALGACDGDFVQMVLYPKHTMHAHITASAIDRHPDARSAHGSIDASLVTLDSFELQDVDLIKIDVEGYELNVLKGASETLRRWRPTIIVEQKPDNGSRYGLDDLAALAWLEECGARCVAKKAGDFVFTW